MAIAKKTLKKIQCLSVMDEVLKDNLKDDYFAETAPDTWQDDEKKLYDMLCEVEYKIIGKVIQILSPRS